MLEARLLLQKKGDQIWNKRKWQRTWTVQFTIQLDNSEELIFLKKILVLVHRKGRSAMEGITNERKHMQNLVLKYYSIILPILGSYGEKQLIPV